MAPVARPHGGSQSHDRGVQQQHAGPLLVRHHPLRLQDEIGCQVRRDRQQQGFFDRLLTPRGFRMAEALVNLFRLILES